jgi:D-3-phosphoglycerate dehydrogenase
MDSHPVKQQIILENVFENYNIERELLHSTPYELRVIDISKDDLLACFSSMPVAIINIRIPITAEIVSQMPSSVKVITQLRVGYDKILAKACRERNIEVCYVPDYGTTTVADHAVALVFAAQRRLLTLHKSIVNTHKWNYRIAGKLRNLNTITLGIIGCGRIGTCFADKIRPFVKEILTHNSKDPTTNTLKEIFEQCDIISLHIPYSSANHHLISSETIAQMKRQPILINVSRGGLIDTKALVQALKSGQISYAALDVLENEPIIDEELIQLDNVLLTPHAAWYSVESEQSLRQKAIEDILRVLNVEKPLYPVPQ